MMRSAGYHVRVVPREDLGWEENPPTLLEFMRRDLRWCQGNMQYWRFLFAAEPEAGQPLSAGARDPDVHRLACLDRLARPRHARARYGVTIPPRSCAPMPDMRCSRAVLVMWFSPKIAGALDVLLSPEERRAFGGAGRFTVNFVIETMYSIMLCPILWISHTIFLFGLLFNREISWMGQVRDDHAVPFDAGVA